jgi:hypothetical protein
LHQPWIPDQARNDGGKTGTTVLANTYKNIERLLILCETPSSREELQKIFLPSVPDSSTDKPKSKLHKYRLTPLGMRYLQGVSLYCVPMLSDVYIPRSFTYPA